jgi:hypothetical protein
VVKKTPQKIKISSEQGGLRLFEFYRPFTTKLPVPYDLAESSFSSIFNCSAVYERCPTARYFFQHKEQMNYESHEQSG